MSIFGLSIKNILAKPWSTALSLVLIAFGVGIISLLIIIDHQVEEKLEKNSQGVDLVVGAKGSPLQLVLSSVYHIDNPTGNIELEEADKLGRHPMVRGSIPLALGDNYRGFRIVGTESAYVDLYEGELADGELWNKMYQVTIGYEVALKTGMKLGSYFHGAHGVHEEDGGDHHDHVDYKVVGILKPTGSVLDNLILCSVESVWGVHTDSENENASKEITALILQAKTPMARLAVLPNFINENTNMMAANPAIEIQRLFGLLESAYDLLRYLAIAIMIISGFSIFISLFNALKQRKYEIALIRTLGGSRMQTFLLVLYEGLIISILGFIIGMIFSHFAMIVVGNLLGGNLKYSFSAFSFYPEEFLIIFLALVVGVLASVLPALSAYNTDISETLTEN